MAMTQMNTRIDEDLKSVGDKVFASMGMSPSEVVRAVWEFAANHNEAPAIVVDAMCSPMDELPSIEQTYRHQLAETACDYVARYRESRNIAPLDKLDAIDYAALREEAWSEKLAERGLA